MQLVWMDTGPQPTQIPLGIAPGRSLYVTNPTPLNGLPSVTVYIGYSPAVTVSTAPITVAPGTAAVLPSDGTGLSAEGLPYAISSSIGLLAVMISQ